MINDPTGKFVVTLHISINIGQRTETKTNAAATTGSGASVLSGQTKWKFKIGK